MSFRTGLFVRDYLKKNGPCCVHELYRAVRDKKEELGLETGSYDSFRQYFWRLKELNLVEFVKEEEHDGFGEPKRYYDVADYDNNAWRDPGTAYRNNVD